MTPSAHYSFHPSFDFFEGTLTSHIFPWHFHPSYTVVIVEAGSMKYVFRNREITVGPEKLLIISPFESHFNTPVGFCAYKVIFIPIEKINQSAESIVHFEMCRLKSTPLVKEVARTLSQVRNGSDPDLKDLISHLMHHIPHSTSTIQYDERILPAVDFVKKNINEKITINTLADACALSKFHFQRVFRNSIGLTVNAYIQQQRIELSKDLILHGSTIVNAALDSGYYDQSHFHKQFTRMYGVTPASFGH